MLDIEVQGQSDAESLPLIHLAEGGFDGEVHIYFEGGTAQTIDLTEVAADVLQKPGFLYIGEGAGENHAPYTLRTLPGQIDGKTVVGVGKLELAGYEEVFLGQVANSVEVTVDAVDMGGEAIRDALMNSRVDGIVNMDTDLYLDAMLAHGKSISGMGAVHIDKLENALGYASLAYNSDTLEIGAAASFTVNAGRGLALQPSLLAGRQVNGDGRVDLQLLDDSDVEAMAGFDGVADSIKLHVYIGGETARGVDLTKADVGPVRQFWLGQVHTDQEPSLYGGHTLTLTAEQAYRKEIAGPGNITINPSVGHQQGPVVHDHVPGDDPPYDGIRVFTTGWSWLDGGPGGDRFVLGV